MVGSKQNISILKTLMTIMISFIATFPVYAVSIRYEYDDLNRLTRAVYDETTVIEYTYDEVGNRTRRVSTLIADTAVDGAVDFHDFAIVASRWLDQECGYADEWCQRADIDWSSDVGFDDLAFLAQQWLESVTP